MCQDVGRDTPRHFNILKDLDIRYLCTMKALNNLSRNREVDNSRRGGKMRVATDLKLTFGGSSQWLTQG